MAAVCVRGEEVKLTHLIISNHHINTSLSNGLDKNVFLSVITVLPSPTPILCLLETSLTASSKVGPPASFNVEPTRGEGMSKRVASQRPLAGLTALPREGERGVGGVDDSIHSEFRDVPLDHCQLNRECFTSSATVLISYYFLEN